VRRTTRYETRKQSLYFPVDVLQEIQAEAVRQDRSLSWVVQRAWQVARERIANMPNAPGTTPPASA
jgi:uncharacterized small protein (TIGR04563 family)